MSSYTFLRSQSMGKEFFKKVSTTQRKAKDIKDPLQSCEFDIGFNAGSDLSHSNPFYWWFLLYAS